MIIVDKLRRFADASAVLNLTDAANCAKVTEVAKRVMWERARMFVLQNATVPLLYSYSGDGTPMTTKARIVATVSDARVVHRSGGNLFEYLMQKAFLKRVSLDGSHTVVPLFRDPVVMSQGKDALQQFAACEEFFPRCGSAATRVSRSAITASIALASLPWNESFDRSMISGTQAIQTRTPSPPRISSCG